MSYIKQLFLILFLTTATFAKDSIYFLPNDSKAFKKDVAKLINKAKTSIDISMYNFSYKKFAKELKKASKDGVKVSVIYGKSDLKFYKKINLKTTKRKLHTKFAIIDDSIVIFGSANWTKKSFDENYEVVHISDNKSTVNRYKNIFKTIKDDNDYSISK